MNLVPTLKTPRVFITKASISMVFTQALAVLYDSHTARDTERNYFGLLQGFFL